MTDEISVQGIIDIAKDRTATNITPTVESVYTREEIIASNKRKWKSTRKELEYAYSDIADFTNFSNTDDLDAGSLIKLIIDIYKETAVYSKEDAVLVKKLQVNMLNTLDMMRILTVNTNRETVVCKLESFVNHIT
jgi:hypothetical protein